MRIITFHALRRGCFRHEPYHFLAYYFSYKEKFFHLLLVLNDILLSHGWTGAPLSRYLEGEVSSIIIG